MPGAHQEPELSCLLFVYGSLKRGQANHGQLGAAHFLARVRTAPSFALRMIDGFPALVPGARSIAGELHRVPTQALPALDDFEGDGYARGEVELADGSRAVAYLARVPSAGALLVTDEWRM